MSYEDRLIGRIDRGRERRDELSPLMERAYEKARIEVLNNPDYVIQEKDFADIYGLERVQKDIATTRMLERKFAAERTVQSGNSEKIAKTLEAIVLMQSEMSEWLGNATTLKTAAYDDYVNKVDMLTEWYTPQEGSRVLALAVDVTFGTSTIKGKLDAIRKEIDTGRLGSIRYFKDSRDNFLGVRNNVPRTVIGIGQPAVESLASLWLNNEKKQLGRHPVQKVFINQIGAQLLSMRDYAQRNGHTAVADAYDEALSAVRPVRASKVDIPSGTFEFDPVAKEIAAQTREAFTA